MLFTIWDQFCSFLHDSIHLSSEKRQKIVLETIYFSHVWMHEWIDIDYPKTNISHFFAR